MTTLHVVSPRVAADCPHELRLLATRFPSLRPAHGFCFLGSAAPVRPAPERHQPCIGLAALVRFVRVVAAAARHAKPPTRSNLRLGRRCAAGSPLCGAANIGHDLLARFEDVHPTISDCVGQEVVGVAADVMLATSSAAAENLRGLGGNVAQLRIRVVPQAVALGPGLCGAGGAAHRLYRTAGRGIWLLSSHLDPGHPAVFADAIVSSSSSSATVRSRNNWWISPFDE